jgi:hypothetical protein
MIRNLKKYKGCIILFCIIILCILIWNYYIISPLTIYRNDTNNENTNIYVSSRGILKSCDIFPSVLKSSSKDTYIDYLKIKEGSVVYVSGSAIPQFAKNIHLINSRFILVSGDCDESVPDMIFETDSDFKNFIESDKIIHWFSQNAVKEHLKLSKIPIGIDYHTKDDAQEQENILLECKSSAPTKFKDRKIKCYSNFHFNKPRDSKFSYDREDAIKKIDKDLIFYEPVKLDRTQSWINQTEYAFVVSPHGNGLDCHRTWEALILGCIPIVKTSPIDSLFDELPVLIVRDWSDLTREKLLATVNAFSIKQFNYEKLYLSYWMNLIRNAEAYPAPLEAYERLQ